MAEHVTGLLSLGRLKISLKPLIRRCIPVQQELREVKRQLAALEGRMGLHENKQDLRPAEVDWTSPLPLQPLGILRSCFSKRSGAPRQPLLTPHARGVLELR